MARRILTGRERFLVGAGTAVFFLMILWPSGRYLSRSYRATHEELVAAAERYHQARDLRRTVLEQRRGSELIEKRVSAGGKQFDLYNFTGTTLDRLGLKETARFKSVLSPGRVNIVSVELQGVGLNDLVDLMHALQHGENLVALELLNNIEVNRDKKGLNCSITLSSPKA